MESPIAMPYSSPVSSSSSKKRRFQVPITKYFASKGSPASENDTNSHFNYTAPTHTAHPVLPNSIQSSLLSVGMRVRKAVPDGYQTTLTSQVGKLTHRMTPTSTSKPTQSTSSTHYPELVPFSGILKVGNLAVQSFPRPVDSTFETGNIDEEYGIPFSSQESTESVDFSLPAPPPPNLHKRRGFEIDEDDGTITAHDPIFGSVPFRSAHPHSHSRTILLPRSGRSKMKRRSSVTKSTQPKFTGQENYDPAYSPSSIRQQRLLFPQESHHDFAEAVFLRRREEVDDEYYLREVEMDGA
ncbi:hypothetical protein FQN57_001828 [Myotisia sp. PD_48]|nr:hypothetical protein FQN57_001828 [Myotisia sp. PD_48]